MDCKKCEPVEPLKAGGFLSCRVAIPTRWSKLLTLQNKGRKSVPGHATTASARPLYGAISGSRVCFVWVAPWITDYRTRGSLIRNDAPP